MKTLDYEGLQLALSEIVWENVDLIGKNNTKYLSMKLDYNYYYSTIEKEKKDKEDLKIIKNINKEDIRKKILNDEENTSRYQQSE